MGAASYGGGQGNGRIVGDLSDDHIALAEKNDNERRQHAQAQAQTAGQPPPPVASRPAGKVSGAEHNMDARGGMGIGNVPAAGVATRCGEADFRS